MSIQELRETNNRNLIQARALMDSNKSDSGEINAQVDRIFAEIEANRSKIARYEELEKVEAEMRSVDESRRPHTAAVQVAVSGGDDREAFRSWLRAGGSPPSEKRAQVEGTGSAGGYLVPASFYTDIITATKAYAPLMADDMVSVFELDNGRPLPFPTLNDTANQGYLISEAAQRTANNVTYGQTFLNAYSFTTGVITYSLELLQDNAFDLDAELVKEAGVRYGRVAGQYLTTGTGSNQPTGIITAIAAANTNVSTANVATVVFDDVQNTFFNVDVSYRDNPKAAWMMNDSTYQVLHKLKDNYGRYLLNPDVTLGNTMSILGKKIIINNQMPTIASGNIAITFGDMSKFYVRRVKDFSVVQLRERYADQGLVGFVSLGRFDSNLMDNTAVKGLKIS